MQLIPRKPAVLDDSERREIFMLLTGKHVIDILEIISDRPRSALEIGKICKIGSSNVYRALNKLSRYNLVKVTGSIGIDGKKTHLYQSKIKSIIINLNSDYCPVVTVFEIQNRSKTSESDSQV